MPSELLIDRIIEAIGDAVEEAIRDPQARGESDCGMERWAHCSGSPGPNRALSYKSFDGY